MQGVIHMRSTWHPRGVRGHAPPLGKFISNLVESGTVFIEYCAFRVIVYKALVKINV